MKDFRNVIFVLVVLTFILQMYVMNQDAKAEELATSKPTVAVSTFALYDITKHITNETVNIVNILPFGVDAHSFEPTPKLMVSLAKSKLVLYSGAGLEPWTKGFHFTSRAVDISQYVKLRELDAEEFEHHAHHDQQCVHNKIDPHYWLDIENMKLAANIVTAELVKVLPKNEKVYTQNRDRYINLLNELDQEYKNSLKECRVDTIITNHNAFTYLSQRYGFKVEALSGLSPDVQASAKDITRLMHHIKESGVSTIFFESFVSDRVMKSIAHDTKVDVQVLQPLGNITKKEEEEQLSYVDIMRDNLHKLHKALMCK